jgi:hypothetical protein
MTKSEVKEESRQYRKYDKDLKDEVCKLAEAGVLSHKELGAKFDIPPNLIRTTLVNNIGTGLLAAATQGTGVHPKIRLANF